MGNTFDGEFWKEEKFVCKYCGIILSQDTSYCSEECEKHDSPWNWNDD